MVAILLKSGAYSDESYIANAQRCVNFYPEVNPANTSPPVPVTHLPRSGHTLLSQCPNVAPGRGLYRSTRGVYAPDGDLFAVVGQNVYVIDPDFTWHQIGTLQSSLVTPVSMADNGSDILIVDGTTSGYQIALPLNTAGYATSFTQLGDPNFVGSTRADFIDGFIILNRPGTNEWYSTTLDAIQPFNALYEGKKTAWPDNILCVVAIEREVWVLGPQKSEAWYNAGALPFPFQIVPGIIIEQGCSAVYSPAKMDTNLYWLSESPEGDRMVMMGNAQNVAKRISTHAIEYEFRTYPRIDDAIGSVMQTVGHSFYKLHFPTADVTWVYDQATEQWHQEAWIDTNGVLHRSRVTFSAFAYGRNVGLDFSNGNLYQIDPTVRTDNGLPIAWIRSFPHSLNEMKRISYSAFIADVATGDSSGTGNAGQFLSPWSSGFSSGFGPLTQVAQPTIYLRVSKDGGKTFGSARAKVGLSSGQYRKLMRWRSFGVARDMVFELSSTAEMIDGLNAGYFDGVPGST